MSYTYSPKTKILSLLCVLLSEESAIRYCIIARDYLEGIVN